MEGNVRAVANPVEQMFLYAASKDGSLAAGGGILNASLLETLAGNFGKALLALLARTWVVYGGYVDSLALEWLLIAGAVWAWRRGERRVVLQVGLFLLATWVIAGLAALRSQRPIYVEPLLIVVGALLLARLPALLKPGRAARVFAALLIVYAGLGLYQPLHRALRRDDPAANCYWFPALLKRVEGFPFCQPPEARSDEEKSALSA
jgi:hypothetical protein